MITIDDPDLEAMLRVIEQETGEPPAAVLRRAMARAFDGDPEGPARGRPPREPTSDAPPSEHDVPSATVAGRSSPWALLAGMVGSIDMPPDWSAEHDHHLYGVPKSAPDAREWTAGMVDLLSEAVRTRRVPGVVFVDGRTARRPMVAGTGVDVWELVAIWNEVGRDDAEFRKATDWLSDTQRRAALNYYALYPDEIDVRLGTEEGWTAERVREELQFSAFGSAAPARVVGSRDGP